MGAGKRMREVGDRLIRSDALSDRAAQLLLGAIRENPRIVLGLPTGRTPIGMYERVVRECAREYHCFRDVTTFNLDEYVGVPREHPGSYFTYMKQHLFGHVDSIPRNAHLPNGMAADLDAECVRYENEIRDAGGLELTFLGLGRNGHIGFNEPGTPFDSRTRVVELTQSTRHANADLLPRGPRPDARHHHGHRHHPRVAMDRAARGRRGEGGSGGKVAGG